MKLKSRQLFMEFGKDNPLPDKLKFLKGVRPRFFAINCLLNKETGEEEIGVEYTIRSAKAIFSSLENTNGLSLNDIKKAVSKISDLAKHIDILTHGHETGLLMDGGRSSTTFERFTKFNDQDILKSLEFSSMRLNSLFEEQTNSIASFENDNELLFKENAKLKKKIFEFDNTPLKVQAENERLIEEMRGLKAARHEDQIKLGSFKTEIKGLQEDIRLIRSEHLEEIKRLYSEIDKLKSEQ